MQRLDRILAVIDPTVEAQPGAAKAARLARLAGASLELFTCGRWAGLDALAEQLRQTGLDVATHAHVDEPLHEAVLRRIAECEPDLVCKDTGYHPVQRQALFTGSDWQLARACPVPLLLSRTPDWPARPRVLAALDPGHHADKPAALDHDILAAAQLMARHLGGDVEAVHVFFPASLLAVAAAVGGVPLAPGLGSADLAEAEREHLSRSMHEIAQAHGLDAQAVRFVQGAAAELLPRLAAEWSVDLLVMGAVSRSRLRELLVGSTAERVLDRLPCDVLIIRSPDFRRALPY